VALHAQNTCLRAFWRVCIAIVSVALVLIVTTTVVFAQTQKMDAPTAYSATRNDDLILLDIRSPGEWAETGIAEGAWPVTMHDPDFSTNLQQILAAYPDRPVALICATGGRSDYVAGVLAENNIPGVIDIAEGMFGNGDAQGWIARGLPIVDVQTARASHAASMSKHDK